MFVIEQIFIDDAKLAKVLMLLDGLVYNMAAPRPVTNAVVRNGKVKQDQPHKPKGVISGKMADKISQRTGLITTDELKLLLADAGGAPTSLNNMTSDFIRDGILERKSRGIFEIKSAA